MKLDKKYQLRWLFYRNKKNLAFRKNNFTATERCCNCKKGVSKWISYIFTENDGSTKFISNCPHCNKELKREKNISIIHKLYESIEYFWSVLDWLHICRNTAGGRYDFGNDEWYLVKGYYYTDYFELVEVLKRKRKWWEYVIIEKH